MTKSEKSRVTRAINQALRRRVYEETGCRKQPVIRAAVWIMYPHVHSLVEAGSSRSIEQIVAGLPMQYVQNSVSLAGRQVRRKRARKNRNRTARRKVYVECSQLRGTRVQATTV